MRKIRIQPYKSWSGGAKRLGQHAGILRATAKQVEKHGDFDVIINWGSTVRRFAGEYINPPEAVERASNKLTACELFRDANVPAPRFCTTRSEAETWLDDGNHVIARTMLRANSGRGIVLVGPEGSGLTSISELPNAPLYTLYCKKATEYRVHVFNGEVIDVQQKKRDTSVPDDEVNWQIRNHHNGWIFARDGVDPPGCVIDSAVAAVASLGLDFGAVDIGYNTHHDAPAVYEVNTAPGLEGSTLDAYYNAFRATLPALNGGMYAKRRAA